MAESFENLDTILRDWAKDKVQKILVESLNRYKKWKKKNKAISFLENDSENTNPSTKLVLVSREPLHCFISNLTSPVSKMFMRLIHLKNSTFLSNKITVDTLMSGMKHQNITSYNQLK